MKKLLFLLSLFMAVKANAQLPTSYVPVAGGTFNSFADMRKQRGTIGVKVSVLTRDSMTTTGLGDALGGDFYWCNDCTNVDDSDFYLKVVDVPIGCWVRVRSALNTNLLPGTYNRLTTGKNGRIIRAYYDSTASNDVSKDSFNNYASHWAVSALMGYINRSLGDSLYQMKSNMSIYPTSQHVDSLLNSFAGFAGSTFYPLTNPTKYISYNDTSGWYAKYKGNVGESGQQGVKGDTGLQGIQGQSGVDGTNASFSLTTFGNSGEARYRSGVLNIPNYITDISAKLNYADTSGMLNNYELSNHASATFQPKGDYLVSEVDGSTTNEIQSLSIAGQNLSLSLGGGTITLPVQDLTPYATNTGLNLKLNIADTSVFLRKTSAAAIYQPIGSYLTTIPNTYMKYVDTSGLSARINNKFNIADTTGKWLNANYSPTGYDSVQIFGSSGRIKQKLKFWVGITTPTTGSGQTIDISSAGFTTILDVQIQVFANTASATTTPLVSGKTYSTTSVSCNLVVSNNNTISSLLDPIVGLLFATSFTGYTLHTLVVGY